MAENNEKSTAGSAKKEKKQSFWQGVKREWKKIIWTSPADLRKQTGIVIVISLVMGIIITAIDSGALSLIDWILAL